MVAQGKTAAAVAAAGTILEQEKVAVAEALLK
jgi:hypothetical protein